MTTIVTGPINSGKTTWMLKHYQQQLMGDGFVAPKCFDRGVVTGYLCQKLSSGVQIPYMMTSIVAGTFVRDTIGPYAMLESAISMMETQYDQWISQTVTPLYIDDIGPLELSGKGLDMLLKKLIASGLDLVMSVRSECLSDVLERYQLDKIKLFKLSSA